MLNNYFSEVKLRTNKKEIIQLINTLLNNVGDFRHLSMEESGSVVIETLEYINSRYSFNLLHFVNWEECKASRYFSSNYMKKHCNNFAKFTRLIHIKDKYYLEFVVDYMSRDIEKVVEQYPDTTWLIDNYLFEPALESSSIKGKTFVYSLILSNTNGRLSIQDLGKNEINELQSLYPIHYGYVELSLINEEMVNIERSLSSKIQKSTLNDILSSLKSKWDSKYQVWYEVKEKVLIENSDNYGYIDFFAPFYFRETENLKLTTWLFCNNSDYSISACETNKLKIMNKSDYTNKEIVKEPLWH